MNTIYLDPETWSPVVDSSGNIAMAENPYALAQDAASAIKTFLGECYYNQSLGIPYFEKVFAKMPPLSYVKSQLVKAAMTVPEVVSAKCFITSIDERTIHGQVQITDKSGNITPIGF